MFNILMYVLLQTIIFCTGTHEKVDIATYDHGTITFSHTAKENSDDCVLRVYYT